MFSFFSFSSFCSPSCHHHHRCWKWLLFPLPLLLLLPLAILVRAIRLVSPPVNRQEAMEATKEWETVSQCLSVCLCLAIWWPRKLSLYFFLTILLCVSAATSKQPNSQLVSGGGGGGGCRCVSVPLFLSLGVCATGFLASYGLQTRIPERVRVDEGKGRGGNSDSESSTTKKKKKKEGEKMVKESCLGGGGGGVTARIEMSTKVKCSMCSTVCLSMSVPVRNWVKELPIFPVLSCVCVCVHVTSYYSAGKVRFAHHRQNKKKKKRQLIASANAIIISCYDAGSFSLSPSLSPFSFIFSTKRKR